MSIEVVEEEDGDKGKGGAEAPPALVLPFPFESPQNHHEETVLPEEFWHDGSFSRIDWWAPQISWGKWTYDIKTKKIKHALTQKTFNLHKLDTQAKLLRAMTSLMLQPHGDVERFYQLATGVIQKRHGKDWDSFWGHGEEVLTAQPVEKPKVQIHVFGGVK